MKACPTQLRFSLRRLTLLSARRGSLYAACLLSALAVMMYCVISPPPARGVSSNIVISQVYGGGGNSGATYKNDFIELFNRGTTTINIAGWSVQYASATSTSWSKTDILSGSIAPGQYYLIQEAGGINGVTLPTADKSDTINLSSTAGKVALVNNTTALSGSCPSSASIVDFVGYGSTANCFEGSGPTSTLSNTTAAVRAMNGCQDTDVNSADFSASLPNPRNSSSPTNVCGSPTNPTGVGAANPNPVTAGNATLLTVTVTPGANPTSTGLAVTGNLTTIGGTAAQQFFDDGTHGDATAGDNTFSFQATVDSGTSAGLKNLAISIADAQSRSGSANIALTVQVPAPPGDIAISQVYGGGGNSGATYKNDFIELFNRGNTTINLSGLSIQYAGATSASWSRTDLSGSLAPGQYYLIQEATSGANGANLPTADKSDTINLAASAGKVALVNNTTTLSGSCPLGPNVLDFVGYGSSANCFEGSDSTAAPSNTTAVLRRKGGCQDTNDNATDFSTSTPNPRNTSSPFNLCSARADLETMKSAPVSVLASGAINYTITVTNHGPDAALNVVVTDLLPAGLTSVSASDGGILVSNTITWPAMASLVKDASVTFTVTATAPKIAGPLLNTANSVSDTDDPIPGNNSKTATTTVLAGAKFETNNVPIKLTDPAICIGAGDVLTVEANITNTGFTPQGNNAGPEFVAQLPPQLLAVAGSCTASSGTCSVVNASRVEWNGTVAVNASVTITYLAQIKNDAPPATPLCLTSTVNYDSNNDGTNDAATSVQACAQINCPPLGPGDPLPAQNMVSDQKAGSVLIYNLYSSNVVSLQTENTRINLTNTHPARMATVHLFFVDDNSPSVVDMFICLTPNQTISFLTSDLDPGMAGYIVAVAVDSVTGCPINFNFLIGDEYVKLGSGHRANLGAEAFAALSGAPVDCTAAIGTAEIAFDGVSYDLAPRVLAVSNLPSLADGNSTLLVIQHIGGSLLNSASTLGDVLGLLFDDQEQAVSFTFDSSRRQLRQVFSNSFPRTTPRLSTMLPKGRSGWMRLWRVANGALLGAVIVFNTSAPTFSQGHNLHKLTLTASASFTIPVFPPPCQ